MSNIGGWEVFACLLLALIVLGPERLPEAARKVGQFVRQVRSMSTGFQDEVRRAIDLDPDKPFSPEEARIHGLPERVADSEEVPVAEDLESEARARNDTLPGGAEAAEGESVERSAEADAPNGLPPQSQPG